MGCGDGRFLFGLEKRIKNKDLLGVDTSQVAIDIAKAMSPMVSYKCFDICSVTQPLEKFDIATLIEVLEHIPIKEVDNFVMSIANYLKPSGKLILTVPHTNKPVTSKHYQHFDSKSLQKCLSPFFEIETMEFFEKKSRIFNRIINPILRNNLFILNNKFLLNTIFKYYRKYLLTCNEDKCGRILFIARKK
jgi:2-polyprenyl-3-methyl-5-hydroxy-6-metoxy-1,4-benzoquinol methylase